MKNQWIKTLAAVAVFGVACGDGQPTDTNAPATNDGVVKSVDGKSDAWNWRNNPSHFRAELNYKFDELPLEGASERVAWAATYWPYYEDGINYRWQGKDELSPAEKYDKAFNNWEFEDGFMDLKPFDTNTCEFDQEYYDSLGPAAEWTHRNKGNWMSSNGIDDDEDGIEDSEECGWEEDQDRDGVETWWGICHAWAPAAIMEDEPIKPVEHNGVTFAVSDMKALLIQQYDRTDAYMIGGRCNEEEIERDDNGRIVNDDCRDINAGTFHVIIANFLGTNSRPLVIERTTNYEIWNQPFIGFEVTENREVTLEEAIDILDINLDKGNGEFVHGIEEETSEAQAILDAANGLDLDTLDVDARLDRRAADAIVEGRPFNTLAELDEVSYVSDKAFELLLDYAKANGIHVEPELEYVYNDNAERFIEVRLTTDWLTESQPSVDPKTPEVERYTRHDHYHYILELDGEGEVIGGEWVGGSHGNHPDFIWLPVRARWGNPHISIDEVRNLIELSRKDEDDSGDDNDDSDDTAKELTFTNADVVAIPDADPNGIVSVIEVTEDAVVDGLTIDLNIEHTYRGDLIVELRHGGITLNVFDGTEAGTPWEDNVQVTAQDLSGFVGSKAEGPWELVVIDTLNYDTGNVVSWSLNMKTK